MSKLNNTLEQLLKAENERVTPKKAETETPTNPITARLETLPEDLFDVDWNKFTIDNCPIVNLLRLAVLKIYHDNGDENITFSLNKVYEIAGIDDVFTTIQSILPKEEEMAKLTDRSGRNWRFYCTYVALQQVESELPVDIELKETRVLTTLEDVENYISIFTGNPFFKPFIDELDLEPSENTKFDIFKNLVEEEIGEYEVIITDEDPIEYDEDTDEEKRENEPTVNEPTVNEPTVNEPVDTDIVTESRVKVPQKEVNNVMKNIGDVLNMIADLLN